MQASQIATGVRQFRTICTPLSVFVCRGYELGYELCLLGAKRCTLRQTQGNKKVPQIIEFVGLVCLLSGIVRLVQRREGDSNPRYPLGVYTLSRRASSTTRAPLLVRGAKVREVFGITKCSGK